MVTQGESFTYERERESMKLGAFHFSLFLSLTATIFSSVICYDPHDPRGNIIVRWDILSWTPDGYLAVVNITNYQRYRPVQAPGWQLSWTWSKREVIWNVLGATTTNQGDCSKYKANIPSSCEKRPTIVDLTAEAPLINQIEGCCRGGTLTAREEDMETSTAGFQLAVGAAGTTNATVALPHNFTLQAPREGYTCGSARVVDPTRFLTSDRKRFTQALRKCPTPKLAVLRRTRLRWIPDCGAHLDVVCTFSSFLANKAPPCCVSWSSFDHRMSATCPKCACNCRNSFAACGRKGSKVAPKEALGPPVKCTDHMCPTKIHWHLMAVGEQKWIVKVSITNFNYLINYTDWTLLIQHLSLNDQTKVSHANYKQISQPDGLEMFWRIKNYNVVIRASGRNGSTVIWKVIYYEKNSTIDSGNGKKFTPYAVLFNGDLCIMPPPLP